MTRAAAAAGGGRSCRHGHNSNKAQQRLDKWWPRRIYAFWNISEPAKYNLANNVDLGMRKSCSHACRCDPSQIRSSKPKKNQKKNEENKIFFGGKVIIATS
jgi:hypothetical protein